MASVASITVRTDRAAEPGGNWLSNVQTLVSKLTCDGTTSEGDVRGSEQLHFVITLHEKYLETEFA